MAVNGTELLYEHPTNINSTTGFVFDYPNMVLAGSWGHLILFMIFSITFLGSLGNKTEEAFLVASSLTWISSVLMVAVGIVGSYTFIATTFMFLGGIIFNGGKPSL